MDAKSKADFINSVASGTDIPCTKCGRSNKSDSKFCISCGSPISIQQEVKDSKPAFEPAKETTVTTENEVEITKDVSMVRVESKYVEPNNVFAQGLPDWSIEPPQVMVRRR